ncbi:aspartate racemase [Paraburkholderia sp. GAS199]|uniref:amino acid racemase n=1 Tax=Paraburkholderia sp. GAS199 TaxID=3035126 RepID=UPI003D1A6843
MHRYRSLGIVTGAAPLASADVLSKMTTACRQSSPMQTFDFAMESKSWQGAPDESQVSVPFKLHVFDAMRAFERREVEAIVLPCFLSHTFLAELEANLALPVVNIMTALGTHVRQAFPSVRRIGVLTSDAIRQNGLFERYFDAARYEVLHPRNNAGVDCVTSAVYAQNGIKNGFLFGRPIELLRAACADLIAQGADIIVPGLAEIGLVARALGPLEVPLVDSNLVYARYVAAAPFPSLRRPFKVGVVGGVGPAATVDFMGKLVRNTPAARDQDHLKVLVEQNPQIPDRTDALIGHGDDPTLALYAACKALEERGADIVAIPCNTAHAFVDAIQPSLGVPVVNMPDCTADSLRESFPGLREVGVLATTGTLASRVYEKALGSHGFAQIVPGAAAQTRLMNAIYGPRGAKAGHTSGECLDDLYAAVDDLVAQGVRVIVLGCSELPMLLRESTLVRPGGVIVRLVDPTDVLAKRCVAHALGAAQTREAEAPRAIASVSDRVGAQSAYS